MCTFSLSGWGFKYGEMTLIHLLDDATVFWCLLIIFLSSRTFEEKPVGISYFKKEKCFYYYIFNDTWTLEVHAFIDKRRWTENTNILLLCFVYATELYILVRTSTLFMFVLFVCLLFLCVSCLCDNQSTVYMI